MKNLTLLLAALLSFPVFAQYTTSAGSNAPRADVSYERRVDPKSGEVREERVERPVERDSFGNAANAQHDLAVDGAFEGQTIVVVQIYTGTDLGVPFDFAKPKEALKQKGFSVYRYMNQWPAAEELQAKLKKASQLWVVGGDGRRVTQAHVKVIKEFFDSGRGVYLWGDNAPYSDDADAIAKALFDTQLVEHYAQGEKVVGIHRKDTEPGVIRDHLLTTGIEYLYEGHTITNLDVVGPLKPLIYGSDGRVVAGYYDQNGKRAIVDGGFTRLYLKWDTAGTGRYVKNAAAWLANAERFGDKVVAEKVRKEAPKLKQ